MMSITNGSGTKKLIQIEGHEDSNEGQIDLPSELLIHLQKDSGGGDACNARCSSLESSVFFFFFFFLSSSLHEAEGTVFLGSRGLLLL